MARTLHFGRAADSLGMTQPPLSQSIMALEQEIGAPLFARTKRSVALTPLGSQWLGYVQAALGHMDALPEAARRLRDGSMGRLDLSFVSTADYSILPELVRRYTALFPDVELSLTEATSDVQIAALLDGKRHAGLIIAPQHGGLHKSLSYMPLVTEPLIVAVPSRWIDEGRLSGTARQIAPEAVVDAPLILFPQHSAPAFHDLVTGYCTAHGGRAHIVQEAIQMQTIISLVSAEMGVAFVPASLRNLTRTGVRYLDLDDTAPVLETGVAWRSEDITPTIERFLDIAREIASVG